MTNRAKLFLFAILVLVAGCDHPTAPEDTLPAWAREVKATVHPWAPPIEKPMVPNRDGDALDVRPAV